MSRAAKATLAASVLFAGVTVWGVHYIQTKEREVMYAGVIRDEARVAEKKRIALERQQDLERNQERERMFKLMQPTRDTLRASSEQDRSPS